MGMPHWGGLWQHSPFFGEGNTVAGTLNLAVGDIGVRIRIVYNASPLVLGSDILKESLQVIISPRKKHRTPVVVFLRGEIITCM